MINPTSPIAVSLDLHANLAMIANATVVTVRRPIYPLDLPNR